MGIFTILGACYVLLLNPLRSAAMTARTSEPLSAGQSRDLFFFRYLEGLLLFLFFESRLMLFLQTRGIASGWDTAVHLRMIHFWPWDAHVWNIQGEYYAYHPPLAFFLPRLLFVSGMDIVLSVQVVNAIASVIGFLFLRAVLKDIGVLRSWAGLAFLYITSCLPVQIYMAHSVNMDALIYAEACAVLFLSVRLFCESRVQSQTKKRPALYATALVLCLATAMLTKYSGLLLTLIPVLTVFFAGHPTLSPKGRRQLRIACGACAAALLIVSPYYIGRYVHQTGMVLPTNMDIVRFDKTKIDAGRSIRDNNRAAFVLNLFSRAPSVPDRIQDRDQKTMRMLNTWKDVWAGSRKNVRQSPLSLWLSTAEARAAIILLIAGCASFFLRAHRRSPWDRMGQALILFSLLQIFSLIIFAYHYPHPSGITNKGLYIAPALLGFGYLMSCSFTGCGDVKAPRTWRGRGIMIAGLALLGGMMFLNGFLPVY